MSEVVDTIAPPTRQLERARRPSRVASQRCAKEAVPIEPGTDVNENDLQWVSELGFSQVCRRDAVGICGIKRMLFSGAIVVGIAPAHYVGRYCYASTDDAARALAAWDGRGDPPGDWIKFKSERGERYGPGLAAETP